MKNIILLLAFALSLLNVSAQNGATLTKEETINYLSKKATEVVNHKRTATDGYTRYMLSQSVSLSGDKVDLSFKRSNMLQAPSNDCSYYFQYNTQKFNPAHITEIIDEGSKSGETLGSIKIKLVGKTATIEWDFYTRGSNGYAPGTYAYCGCCIDRSQPKVVNSTQEVYFTYLSSDPTNFNKIKKALEHLKALYKAEDDPFGE